MMANITVKIPELNVIIVNGRNRFVNKIIYGRNK